MGIGKKNTTGKLRCCQQTLLRSQDTQNFKIIISLFVFSGELHYINNGTASHLIDPTPEKQCFQKKALKFGFHIHEANKLTSFDVPDILTNELGPLKSSCG